MAIFKIDGDKLTIVAAAPGETDRPTSLKLEEGSQLIEAVFERDKALAKSIVAFRSAKGCLFRGRENNFPISCFRAIPKP